MRTFSVQGFDAITDAVGALGIHYTPTQVTVFEPGDESTPEWLALHPAPDPIAEAKATKREQINAERDAACIAPVEALGRTWQADEGSQALLNKAITLAAAGLPLPVVWRDADNVDLVITDLAQLLAIAGAMAAATQAAYTDAFARKDALKDADTLAEIEAI